MTQETNNNVKFIIRITCFCLEINKDDMRPIFPNIEKNPTIIKVGSKIKFWSKAIFLKRVVTLNTSINKIKP